MSLFAGDFLTGHILLFALAIPCLIPGFAQLHSIALLWLRPSRQIRAPLYSIKQARQRKSIIARCVCGRVSSRDTPTDLPPSRRYGILFLLAVVVFAALIVVRCAFALFRDRFADTSTTVQVPLVLKSTMDLALDGINL